MNIHKQCINFCIAFGDTGKICAVKMKPGIGERIAFLYVFHSLYNLSCTFWKSNLELKISFQCFRLNPNNKNPTKIYVYDISSLQPMEKKKGKDLHDIVDVDS